MALRWDARLLADELSTISEWPEPEREAVIAFIGALLSAAPPSQTLSVPLRFWTWTQHGMPVASSFAGSPSALDVLEVDRGPEKWQKAVRALRPDLEYANGSPLLSTWHDDSWARGAYSARTLSSPLDDEALARLPVGVVTFAGEHTAGHWHGLMEGALRSGLRAAAEVEEQLRYFQTTGNGAMLAAEPRYGPTSKPSWIVRSTLYE